MELEKGYSLIEKASVMPKYLNGINVSSLTLGEGSGAALTTGNANTLLGASAGADLTTGSRNTLVGAYTCTTEPDVQNNVILSNGQGTVVCRWDGSGTAEQPVADATLITPPTIGGRVRIGCDLATGALVYKARPTNGGPAVVSYSANKASVDALGVDAATLGGKAAAAFQLKGDTRLLTSGVGTSMIKDAATLQLRGLDVGSGLTLDATNPDRITLMGPTLQNETNNVPANAQSVIGESSGGAELRTKQLVAGSGIQLTSTPTTLTIVNTGGSVSTPVNTTLTSATTVTPGALSLVAEGTGPNLSVRPLVPGDGVSLTATGDGKAVTVGSTVRLESEPGGLSLVSVGTGSVLRAKSLSAGTGISVTANGSTGLTIANTQAATSLGSAGGSVSLVKTGTGSALVVKGLTAGYNMATVDSATSVTLHSYAPVVLSLRPIDVMASTGQIRVLSQGQNIAPFNWPIDNELKSLSLPTVSYKASATANHSGEIVFAVHGLPRNAQDCGFHLDLTAFAPNGTAGFTWNVTVTLPAPHPIIPRVWHYCTYSGSVTFDTFDQQSSESSHPFQVKEVVLTATSGGDTIPCVDGTSLPHFSRLNGQSLHASPDLLHLRLAGSSPLPTAVDIPGVRLTLIPGVNVV